MFRFTIREWVLLTIIAAIEVGWWLDRSRLITRVSFLEQQSGRSAYIGPKQPRP